MERNNKIMVSMEGFIFIHGSSVGESYFIPDVSTQDICRDIAKKYFSGREYRKEGSLLDKVLFLEMYKTPKEGEKYYLYSFVNNDCLGSNNREGGYFALTVAFKNKYAYPELLYYLLNQAYDQLKKTGRILVMGEDGRDKYVIEQFDKEQETLYELCDNFYEYIKNNFSNFRDIASSLNIASAEYDLWNGVKISIDDCNSKYAFERFCETGRLYISDKYPTMYNRIVKLKEETKKLNSDILEMGKRSEKQMSMKQSEANSSIKNLEDTIRTKDLEIKELSKEIENYKASIQGVYDELCKLQFIDKSVAKNNNDQNSVSHSQKSNEKKTHELNNKVVDDKKYLKYLKNESSPDRLKGCINKGLLLLLIISAIIAGYILFFSVNEGGQEKRNYMQQRNKNISSVKAISEPRNKSIKLNSKKTYYEEDNIFSRSCFDDFVIV